MAVLLFFGDRMDGSLATHNPFLVLMFGFFAAQLFGSSSRGSGPALACSHGGGRGVAVWIAEEVCGIALLSFLY
jgi:hypothetical protein